jgi:UPF0271 protein
MIDFNCDLGEGLHNEHLLMPLISSCNIACGGHAGSIEIIDQVIQLAKEHKVHIGAHPSFVDRANFGRVVLEISNAELHQSLVDQMKLFKERAELQDVLVHHVKPHGALYNLIAVNREKAEVVVKAIQAVFERVKLYVPYDSEIEKVAQEYEIEIVYEAFADRNYNDDLTLVSRKESNAVLTDSDAIVEHVSRMAKQSKVKTLSGLEKNIKAQTFCIHGDNENVFDILKELNNQLMSPRA